MATIYIAVETHRDRFIKEVFVNKEKANQFVLDTWNAEWDVPRYYLEAMVVSDEDILVLADQIRENRNPALDTKVH